MSNALCYYFATCTKGLEEVLADELAADPIRAGHVKAGSSGVHFSGDQSTGFRANLWSRCAIRILCELKRGKVTDSDSLYEFGRTINWPDYLQLEQTFSVEARVWDSAIKHSKFAALRIKDALCDIFRETKAGERPSVDTQDADLPLFLSLYKNQALLYRDFSGTTLHKRGYRTGALHKSSLNEALAAGLLRLSGWDRESPLIDPMCGSGTFLIEAAMAALNKAPGLMRREFPFERWPDFNRKAWLDCRTEAKDLELKKLSFPLLGNDHHAGALTLAKNDSEAAGVLKWISYTKKDVGEFAPPFTPSIVITNPPWGDRLAADDLAETWKKLSSFLKSHCDGATAWIFSGSKEATKNLRLRTFKKCPIRHGKQDCRLLGYEIQGRLKDPKKANA